MCFRKRIHILKNIDEKTLEELKTFLKGAVKVYLIFGIVYACFSAAYFTERSRDYALLSLFQSLLYFSYSGSSFFLTFRGSPSMLKLFFSSLSLLLLMIFTITAVLYKFMAKGEDYSVFIDFVSVLFQSSTQFIYYKFGVKIKQRDQGEESPQAALVSSAA
jgi:hypothetical protein